MKDSEILLRLGKYFFIQEDGHISYGMREDFDLTKDDPELAEAFRPFID